MNATYRASMGTVTTEVVPNRLLTEAREGKGWSRQQLADEVHRWIHAHMDERHWRRLDVKLIRKWEKGHVRWPHATYRAALRSLFDAPSDRALGFVPPDATAVVAEILTNMKRRTILRGGVAAALAPAGSFASFLDGLATAAPTRVGAGDIARIREAHRVFLGLERARGGGFALDGALAQLRRAAEYLDVPCPEHLEPDLFSAVGDLADTVGYMAFDAGRFDAAQRVFALAFECGDRAGCDGLKLRALVHLAEVSMWHGRPRDALVLVEQGLDQRGLAPSERALGFVAIGMAHGCRGDATAAVEAVSRADDTYDDAELPPGMAWHTRASHDALAGRALYDLTVATGQDAGAVERLGAAVETQTVDHAVSRAVTQVRLATVLMVTGDPDEAAQVGLAGLEASGPISSERIVGYFETLHRVSTRHADREPVAELRARTADVLLA